MKKIAFLTFILFTSFALRAQIDVPAPSPLGTITQKVGLTEINIEYSRPSTKGRTIFGDLVPFGDLWRTGANGCTKIKINDKASIYGQDLEKGTYSVFTIPDKTEWTIILNKNTELWGSDEYKKEEDALRFVVKPIQLREKVESFTIGTDNITNNSADISLSWEYTKVTFTVSFDTDSKVVADIKSKMDGPSASTYYQSARYYFDSGKDLTTALEWINKSIEKGGEKFWIVRQKALIQAGLKDYKGAIATAERSMQLAKEADNGDYIRLNEKSIMEWKAKL